MRDFSTVVKLNSIDKVKSFVETVSKLDDCELELVSGRYVVNAKSILGVFSLDLSKSLKLDGHCNTMAEAEEVLKLIKEFQV